MKTTFLGILSATAAMCWAQSLTVKEADISGKTNFVAVADTTVNGKGATVLTDDRGFTLYTFARDTVNKSNCAGSCLQEWPPEHVPSGATIMAPFGSIKGNDGQTQLTLQGMPLYHYDDDEKPGDTHGEYPSWDVVVVTK